MPATQTIEVFDGLEFSVEPVEEPDPVYFTSDKPEFNVHIRNRDAKYDFSEGSKFQWTIETDPMEVIHAGEAEFGPIDRGEETTVTVGGEVLAYEGHGVFGISAGSASPASGTDRHELRSGGVNTAEPTYSFHVWDNSHYAASVRRPKRLQIAMFLTSVMLILFAAFQILLAMGIVG